MSKSVLATVDGTVLYNATGIYVTHGSTNGLLVIGQNDGLLTQTDVHYETRNGRMFQAGMVTGAAADNGFVDVVLILTGATVPQSLSWIVASAGDAEIMLYEGVTGTYGVGVTPVNMNRKSSATTNVGVGTGPNISVFGTLLHDAFMPAGNGPLAPGGTSASAGKWILNIGKRYLVRAKNLGGGAKTVGVTVQFYPEENV